MKLHYTSLKTYNSFSLHKILFDSIFSSNSMTQNERTYDIIVQS